jgi:hypothetical protein
MSADKYEREEAGGRAGECEALSRKARARELCAPAPGITGTPAGSDSNQSRSATTSGQGYFGPEKRP